MRRAILAMLAVMSISVLVEPTPVAAQGSAPDATSRPRRPVRTTRAPQQPEAQTQKPAPAARPSRVVRAAALKPSPAPRTAATKPTPVPKVDLTQRPPEPLVAVISLTSQRMLVYGRQGVVATTKVSTGKAGNVTPSGVFSILQRNRYHESNIYSGAPMPFMQRLTWSGIALHQGVVPGYPASHGCIRMPSDFAQQMWSLGRVGMRVLVVPNDVIPSEITHARLPVPVMTMIDSADILAMPIETASIGTTQPAASTTPVAPYPLAHFRRAKAIAEQIAVEKEIKAAQELATERSAVANQASDGLRQLHAAVAAAEADLEDKREALVRKQTADEASPEAMAVTVAAKQLERAGKDLTAASEAERQASDAAFDAAKALRALQERSEQIASTVRLAAAGLEPVSIFISRKEGKVFVRQGFTPIHEEAITIVDPLRPLGTHVFTAIDGRDGGANLRWQVVTLPSNPPVLAAAGEQPRRRGAPPPPQSHLPASSATAVLDRFELPPETLRLIGDRLWSGATLIVSDFGISNETGRGTDFVVLTQ